ncbi:MAG: ABC transporter ATP-binding protein [Bacillota bacterium]
MSEQSRPSQPPAGGMRPGMRRGPGMGHGPGGFGGPVEKAKDFKGTLKRLLVYLRPRWLQLLVVVTMAILSTIFSIRTPKIMGKATTKLFEGLMMKIMRVPGAKVDFDGIWQILMTLAWLYVLSAGFNYVQQFIMAGISQKTVFAMRKDVNQKLTRLPLKFFDSRTHGEILSRVTNDVDTISMTLQQSITQLISAVVTLIGVVYMMLSISPYMTLICLVTLPLSLFIMRPIIKRSQKFFAGQQKSLGELNGHVEEMYTGHKIVKAFGREQRATEEFMAINERLYDAGWKAQFISGLIMPMMSFVNNIGYVLVCVVGSILVTKKSIAIGDVQAFIQYSRQFTQPINQTANISNVIQSTVAAAERVFELLDEMEEAPDNVNAQPVGEIHGQVRFEHVQFGYKEGVPLIADMSIDVKPGQTIAIVGPTGAGKTTLVNLLMRFYELSGGKITVDGQDIREFKRGDLRTIFGMVLQDTWLFNGTIRDNIAYGLAGATDQQVFAAARAAHADHFIRTLPEGYNTVLNEEASNISQGQKQLLTIARAFLADPAILILDEATSSVDTRTELAIQKAMTELMKDRTSFVIAHRLSTIRDAGLILVMNNGSIIEQGNHVELLAKGGFYADLYNSQFTGNSAAVAV